MKGLEALNDKPAPAFGSLFASVEDFLPRPSSRKFGRRSKRWCSTSAASFPTHKKGGTVAYETIIARATKVASLYHSPAMRAYVSRIVGARAEPTPLHDQSSLSVLFYDRRAIISAGTTTTTSIGAATSPC